MAEKKCPRLNKPCIEHACMFYIQLLGTDPQTGEQLNKWGCADAFTPLLLIEVAKEVRQAAAAIESARNEGRKDAASLGAALLALGQDVKAAANRRFIDVPQIGCADDVPRLS